MVQIRRGVATDEVELQLAARELQLTLGKPVSALFQGFCSDSRRCQVAYLPGSV